MPTREELEKRLKQATRLLENFEDWSGNFAEGYLDMRFGGTLAEDVGYQSLYLDVCNFLDMKPALDVSAAEAELAEEGYAVGG